MVTNPELLSRESVIGALRSELAGRANGEMSICKLAALSGVFCKGLSRFSDIDLKRRFSWIVKKNPGVTREALEETVDNWQLARQEVDQAAAACDVQQQEHDLCGGWDDFSDEQLSRFLLELTGRTVTIATEKQ